MVGAIYLEITYHHYEGFAALAIVAEIFISVAVFSLALFLTCLGHVCYQLTMKRHGYQLSQQQIWSRWVALVIVLLAIVPSIQGLIWFFWILFQLSLDIIAK